MKLSVYEKDTLERVSDLGFNYIVRDYDGKVLIFRFIPVCTDGCWHKSELCEDDVPINLPSFNFGFVLYNHKPWNISDLLDQNKINKYIRSTGIVCYRHNNNDIEILLAHPGGPFWKNKTEHCWSVIKGEQDDYEGDVETARREFKEETGEDIRGKSLELFYGSGYSPKKNKFVHCYALEDNFDESKMFSNSCMIEFPPKSGKMISIPENDAYAWVPLSEADSYVFSSQAELISNFKKWIKEKYGS